MATARIEGPQPIPFRTLVAWCLAILAVTTVMVVLAFTAGGGFWWAAPALLLVPYAARSWVEERRIIREAKVSRLSDEQIWEALNG